MRAQKRGTSEQERVSLIRQNQKFILYKKSTRTKTTTSTAKHKHFTAADLSASGNITTPYFIYLNRLQRFEQIWTHPLFTFCRSTRFRMTIDSFYPHLSAYACDFFCSYLDSIVSFYHIRKFPYSQTWIFDIEFIQCFFYRPFIGFWFA